MRLLLSFSVLSVFLFAQSAPAQTTYKWTGGNGPWDESIRWTPEGVPGADDLVEVSSGTITLSGNTTVAHLRLSGQGVITGEADLTITESMVWMASTGIQSIPGTGTVTVAPGATLSLTGDHSYFSTSANRKFVNAGSAVWTSRGGWSGQGQFVNEGELELAHDAAEPVSWCFSTRPHGFVNAADGLVRRTGSGELVFYCPFSNHGRIEIRPGRCDFATSTVGVVLIAASTRFQRAPCSFSTAIER